MPSRQNLPSPLEEARQELQKAQIRIAELEAQLFQNKQNHTDLTLRLFVEHAPAALAMLDRDMHYLLVSRRWLTDYKLGETDVIGRSHYALFPDLPEQWKEIHRRCLAGASASSEADPFPRADGSLDWVRWEIHPWRKPDGTIGGILILSELITERKRAEEQIRKLHRTLGVLSDINQAIVRIRHLPSLFEKACAIAVEKGTFHMAWLGLFHPKTERIEPVAHAGIAKDDLEKLRIVLNTPPFLRALRTEKRLVCNDIQQDALWLDWRAEASQLGYNAMVALPLLVAGEIRGLFSLYTNETDFFDEQELRLMDEMAGDISFAIEVAEQNEQRRNAEAAVKRYTQRLEILHQIDKGIINATSTEELIEAALQHIRRLIPCQRANVALLDMSRREGVLFAIDYDGAATLLPGLRIPIGHNFFDEYDERQIRIVPDFRKVQELNPRFKQAANEGLRSGLGVLLLDHDQPIGTLGIFADTPDYFTPEHEEIISEVGSQLAIAIRQMRLSEELAHHAATLEQQVAKRTADLQAALMRVGAILNNSPDAILLATHDLRIQQVNSSFNTLFGCAWDAYFDQSLLTLFDSADTSNMRTLAQIVASPQNGKRMEVRAIRKDDTPFDAELTIGVISGDGLVCIIRDITERKAQERQLRYHAALQENVNDAVIVTDMALRIQTWNKAAVRTYGWTAEEAIGKVAPDFLQIRFPLPLNPEAERKQFDDYGSLQQESIQQRKDGTDIFILGSATRLEDEKGMPVGVIAINRDITERKAQERQLRYHASIQESVSDAVIATDMQFRIQSWNRTAESIYGWSATETIGKSVYEILQTTYESKEDGERILDDFLKRGAWQGEVIQHHRDGRVIYVHAAVNLFKDEMGQAFGVVSVNRDITERKRTQRAIIESEARYRLLAENISDVIAKMNPAGIRTFITPSCYALLGYTPDELIDQPSINIIHPDDRSDVLTTITEAVSSGKTNFFFTKRFRHKAGHDVWVEITSNIIYDRLTKNPLEIIGVFRDISERKKAETELREAERRYHALFEQSHDAVFLVNMQGHILEVNQRAAEMLGYSVEELRTLGYRELSGETSQSEVLIKQLLAGETIPMYERVMRKKDGSQISVEINVEIVRDLDGNPLHIQSVARDITARKRSEEALRVSEGRYRLLAENIADVIMTFSMDRLITYMSPSCEGLLGYLPEEVEGKSHREFIHPEDYPQVIDRTRRAVASKEAFYTNQFRLRHKAGHYIWYEVRTRIVRNETAGSVVQFISILRDITERKRADDALRESEERFRRAIIDAPFPIMIHADNGEVLHISKVWTEISGYTHAEIPTMDEWTAKAYKENLQTARALIEKVYTLTKPRRGGEFHIWTKAGEERIWDFISAPLAVMPDGRRMISSMAMDITERKHAEETLQNKLEEERQFQVYLKALHEIIIELTAVDQLDAFYKRAVELGRERLGFERLAMFLYDERDDSAVGTYGTDVQGKLVDERGIRFTPDPNGIMQRSFERLERFYFNEGTTLYHDTMAVGYGWNAAAVLWNGTRNLGWFVTDNLLSHLPASKPQMDTLGLYALSVGTLLAQKQIQLAQKESEALYRLLAENISDLIMRSTLTSECLYVSLSVQTLLGYTPEELIGQQTFRLIHPDDQAIIGAAYASALERNELIPPHQYRAKHKAGHYIWLETVGKPLFSEDLSDIVGVITSSREITERRQTEVALRESEEKFRLLLDAAPIATIISDQTGRISLVNVQAENLFGYSRAELNGRMVELLIPDYARDHHVNNRTTYVTTPRVRSMGLGMALYAKHKTGREIPVEIELSYIETQTGMMVMSFIIDVTERKRIAAELEQQRSFLRNVIDVSPNLIFVKDYEGRFVLANPSVAAMHHTTVDALIGKTDADFHLTQQEVDDFLAADRMVITSGKMLFLEEPLTNPTGKVHWLQTTKVPIISADGQSKYVLGVSTDITERKEAEEALRESEQKYRSLVETMRGGLAVFDTDYRVTYVNDRFCELLGYSRAEALGKHPTAFVDAVYLQMVQSHLERRQNAESTSYELPLRRKDGHQIHVLLSGSPLVDKQGNYNGSIVVATDISLQKQAEATLRQALAKEKELGDLKTRFVSMASHEFRTPLATILALVETLITYRAKLSEEQIEQRFYKIKAQIGHLKDIMEDVLMLSRMQAQRVEFNPVEQDLDALCLSVLDEFQSQLDSKHRLEYTASAGVHAILLDRKLMRQILSNLISNAIKYSPKGTSVQIHLEHTDSAVILTVSDEGIGIPEADLPHLFEPFHRAANVGTISGTGLGLVITREAVELHGGTITVESRLGAGTTFLIRIPTSADGEQKSAENFAQ